MGAIETTGRPAVRKASASRLTWGMVPMRNGMSILASGASLRPGATFRAYGNGRGHGCEDSYTTPCGVEDIHTLLAQSKRALRHWMLATFLLCLACSSRRIAREVGVHSSTSYRWYWWLRNAALSSEMARRLA